MPSSNRRRCLAVAITLATLGLTAASAVAAPVVFEIEGRVMQNTFTDFPFDTTSLGSPVLLKCTVESTSGFEFLPGFWFGKTVTELTFTIDRPGLESIVLVQTRNSGLNFSSIAINEYLPDRDYLEFSGASFEMGALDFGMTFYAVDGDDGSWASGDIAQLSPCGVPGTNFRDNVEGDRVHWYISGDTIVGALQFEVVRIRQIATSAGDGDMNGDGVTDGDDVQPFTEAAMSLATDSDAVCHGDFDLDGVVGAGDIPGLVDVLLTGVRPPVQPAGDGACCYLDPNWIPACVNVASLLDCDAVQGYDQVFMFGVPCEEQSPPCFGGACCFGDGQCEVVGPTGGVEASTYCFMTLGGVDFINGGVCEPNSCMNAPMACCLTDGQGSRTGVCVELSETDCYAQNGYFESGLFCDENPCLVACCFSDASCVELSEEYCMQQGGNYLYGVRSCDYRSCPPVNDRCSDAIPIYEGSTAFDIGGATRDGDELPMFTPGCELGFAATNYIENDIWFTYTPATSGLVQMDTCGSYYMGESTFTTIAVYDDCTSCPPDSETSLVVCTKREQSSYYQLCVDPSAGSGDAALRFNAVAGTCYKIRLGTEVGSTFGYGVLNIVLGGACCPPDGGFCTIETQYDCENVIGGHYAGDGTDCTFTTCPGACCYQNSPLDAELVCEIVTGVNSCYFVNPSAAEPQRRYYSNYLGDATTCDVAACGGACCFADADTSIGEQPCQILVADECATMGGEYLGDGITCHYTPLGLSTCDVGACCDGATCVNEHFATCAYDFVEGEDCATYVCYEAQMGACCDGINCTTVMRIECHGDEEEFFVGEDCSSFTCPDARVGACCDGVICTDVMRMNCTAEDAIFYDNHLCTDPDWVCPALRSGVCCNGATCTDTIWADCDPELGSIFWEGEECSSFTCPAARVGACCLANETCEEMAAISCVDGGGYFNGADTVCSEVDCTIPDNAACGGEGDCFEAHSTPGCAAEACCEFVCAHDEYCCSEEGEWDGQCVDLAEQLCSQP